MKCGQILLLDYPFTDMTGSKIRPALVVSADAYNDRQDFVAVPISAQGDPNDSRLFPLDPSAAWFAATKLRPASRYVRWSKLMTLTTKVVHSRLGLMPTAQLDQIQRQIRGMFGSH